MLQDQKVKDEVKGCTFEPYVSQNSWKIAENSIGKSYASVWVCQKNFLPLERIADKPLDDSFKLK